MAVGLGGALPPSRAGVRGSGSCRIVATWAADVRGEAEAPALPQPIRIHEPCVTTEVAAEVEGSQRRPISPVAQKIVRDPPQRVARLHGIGRGRRRAVVGGVGAPAGTAAIGEEMEVCPPPTGVLAPAPAANERARRAS